jgi:hypothetical protein
MAIRRRVPPRVIRKIFNDNGYLELVKSGAWTARIDQSEPIRRPFPGHPRGTRSQIVHYLNERGHVMAIVHQYRKPDGSIGGKGKPDPKFLVHKGVLYHAL